MKIPSSLRRIVLFFGLCFVFGMVLLPAQAQGQNLLTNPGFEKPFVTLDGNPPRQVAQGWSPWNLSGGQSTSENIQPSYFPASDVTDGLGVPRIRSGSDAQQYLSFFATHDGGLYQRVTNVTSGAQLSFSAYVYVWSTTYDDVNKSDSPGGVVVSVGIDPTGGTAGDSSNIVWSTPSVQYDAYNQYTVTATAAGTAVTVFIRSTVSTPVKNNDIYVDDASLTVVGSSQPPTATKTPAPPTATNTIQPTKTAAPPTATNTVAPTATNTSLPPTATNTVAPTATDQGIVPTDTAAAPQATPEPPTAAPLPTNTLEPTVAPPTQEAPVPTDTAAAPTPTATETPINGEFFGKVLHTVQPGDTVGQLATLYGSTTDAIISANGLNDSALIRVGQVLVVPVRLAAPATSTPTVTPLVPPTQPPSVTTTYVVVSGDTLNRIAARFNTTAATLAQLNGIANPNIIHVGQRLTIPTGGSSSSPVPPPATSAPSNQPTTYVVRTGDTLFRIALHFGVSVNALTQANNIRDPNLVFVGQVLTIP